MDEVVWKRRGKEVLTSLMSTYHRAATGHRWTVHEWGVMQNKLGIMVSGPPPGLEERLWKAAGL